MKFRYITIEREYGSGGTKIARRLSEISGVPCYGHEILEAVAKKQGIPVERINQYEEKSNRKPDLFYVCYEPGADRRSEYADRRRKGIS